MAEKSMASDDEKFEKLKTYNYKHNRVFQDGWRKVKACVTQEMLFDSFVKAQVFFYSREVEPISIEEYKTWLKDKEVNTDEYLESYMPESGSDCEDIVVKSTTDNKDITPDCDKNSAPKHPETFGELIEMIQSGLKLPDTEGPEIEATNDDPTPPVLERKKKHGRTLNRP